MFPRFWILSAATPVPKPGDANDITSYRPIANTWFQMKYSRKSYFWTYTHKLIIDYLSINSDSYMVDLYAQILWNSLITLLKN